MEETIFEYLSSQGVFAVLFSGLLIYVLKMFKSREEHYHRKLEETEQILLEIRDLVKETNHKNPAE